MKVDVPFSVTLTDATAVAWHDSQVNGSCTVSDASLETSTVALEQLPHRPDTMLVLKAVSCLPHPKHRAFINEEGRTL